MATARSPHRKELLTEVDQIPVKYLPELVKMMRAFREGVMLPSAEESFREG